MHLRIYSDKSELIDKEGNIAKEFREGNVDSETSKRYEIIKNELKRGALSEVIEKVKNDEKCAFDDLGDEYKGLIGRLVDSVTAGQGRAIVALTIAQLIIKKIAPEQDIRLHKGGKSAGDFSWVGGISMRSLDKQYITPALRSSGLISLNADGFMMTRSLAENYPYTPLYKAQVRGAKEDWLLLVDAVERLECRADIALEYIISLLLNRTAVFEKMAEKLVSVLPKTESLDFSCIKKMVLDHIDKTDYSARLFEVAIHAGYQAAEKLGVLEHLSLSPLSQMRSANKKHGNIADIELFDGDVIAKAYDAKYGKAYLREELDELDEKLAKHFDVKYVAFISSTEPIKRDEINGRIEEIEFARGIKLEVLSFDSWLSSFVKDVESAGRSADEFSREWFCAYAESLAQKRRDKAPIDEPCQDWVSKLIDILDENGIK